MNQMIQIVILQKVQTMSQIAIEPIPVVVSVSTEQQTSPFIAQQIEGYAMNGNMDSPIYMEAPIIVEGSSVMMTEIKCNHETISGEDMRQALKTLVSKKLFWGKGAVKSMDITNIKTWSCYHCQWESYMDKRTSKWKSRPYEGGIIDGANNGTPPMPWEIIVNYPPVFEEDTIDITIPHTESVHICDSCLGRGRKQCQSCSGRGRDHCYTCNGSGRRTNGEDRINCYNCNGDGRTICSTCKGDGMTKCKICKGHGQVIMYVNLTVSYINHIEHKVLNDSGMPDDMIRESQGTILSQQSGYRVIPPQDIFDPSIQMACSQLYTNANVLIAQNEERLLQQRVTVRIIPVAKADGSWKGKSSEFWVHGNNKIAYAPRYLKEFYHGCVVFSLVCYEHNTLYYISFIRLSFS